MHPELVPLAIGSFGEKRGQHDNSQSRVRGDARRYYPSIPPPLRVTATTVTECGVPQSRFAVRWSLATIVDYVQQGPLLLAAQW